MGIHMESYQLSVSPYFAYMCAKQVIQQKHLFPQLLLSNVLLKSMFSFCSRPTGVQLQ